MPVPVCRRSRLHRARHTAGQLRLTGADAVAAAGPGVPPATDRGDPLDTATSTP
ncbi:hypothetical protein ACFWIB_41220 [Streptomyces sp. NPDC127051]|uniref:hypothetical protein n=1 Tax=Streptomyces sp. NPDC127051 TaxID=3347119 RepID=UPI00365A8B3D